MHAVYDHSHPSNSTFGGSVKVYCVDPDLSELSAGDHIPHTLRDSHGELYICTARRNIHAGTKVGSRVTTAAVALDSAIKWLSVFELWLTDEVSDEQFSGHAF